MGWTTVNLSIALIAGAAATLQLQALFFRTTLRTLQITLFQANSFGGRCIYVHTKHITLTIALVETADLPLGFGEGRFIQAGAPSV